MSQDQTNEIPVLPKEVARAILKEIALWANKWELSLESTEDIQYACPTFTKIMGKEM